MQQCVAVAKGSLPTHKQSIFTWFLGRIIVLLKVIHTP